MIRSFLLSAAPAAPREPGGRLPSAPADRHDPAGYAFLADWLAHVDAGRVGSSALTQRSGGATGTPGTPEAIRAVHAANARLFGVKGASSGR